MLSDAAKYTLYAATLLLCLIAGAPPVLPASALAGETEDPAAAMEGRIAELRQAGKHDEALTLARERLALIRADPMRKAWKVRDAEITLESLERLVSLPEAERNALVLADSLTKGIIDHNVMGEYREMASVAERQLELRKQVFSENIPDVVVSMAYLAKAVEHLGHYARAESLLRDALDLNMSAVAAERPATGSLKNELAHVLENQGRYSEAEKLYREALELDRKFLGDEHPDVLCDIHNLALVLRAQGDYREAGPLFLQALQLGNRLFGEDDPTRAAYIESYGYFLRSLGDYVAAEALYREALEIRRRLVGEEHPMVAISLNNVAFILHRQFRYAESEQLYRQALSINRNCYGAEHVEIARNLNNLAPVLSALGDKRGAEDCRMQALSMWRSQLGNDHPLIARCLHNIAEVYAANGDYALAESLHLEALEINRKALGPEHPHCALTEAALAELHQAQGDYAGAEPLARDALEIRRAAFGENHPDVVRSLCNLARLHMSLEDYESAEAYFTRAAEAYEVARLRTWTGLVRSGLVESPYLELAETKLILGKEAEAWPSVEKSRGRVLADLILTSGTRTRLPAETAREDSLRRTISELEHRLGALREAARGDSVGKAAGEAERARSLLLAAEADLAAFRREIAGKYPVQEGQSYDLRRVQAALPENAALIGWLDGRSGNGEPCSWGYVIQGFGPVKWVRLAAPSGSGRGPDPARQARSLHDELSAPAFVKAATLPAVPGLWAARGLWTARVRPLIEGLAGIERLIVIPSGIMLGVPIEALVDESGVYLGERYAVTYAPSATIYAWLVERSRAETHSGEASLFVGDPPFSQVHLVAMEGEMPGGAIAAVDAQASPDAATFKRALAGDREAISCLPRLPGTREEVMGLAALSEQATVLVGPRASEEEILRLAQSGDLSRYGKIHLATHALVDDTQPERSALVLSQVNLPDPLQAALSGERICDGLLTAKEIIVDWRLDADLVILSACNTGLGRKAAGEGYIGLADAFLQAGARNLVVSLWSVEDKSTCLLMRRFYENLSGSYHGNRAGRAGLSMPKAEALREAKSWLRTYTDGDAAQPYQHPYFWSAFILIGEGG